MLITSECNDMENTNKIATHIPKLWVNNYFCYIFVAI